MHSIYSVYFSFQHLGKCMEAISLVVGNELMWLMMYTVRLTCFMPKKHHTARFANSMKTSCILTCLDHCTKRTAWLLWNVEATCRQQELTPVKGKGWSMVLLWVDSDSVQRYTSTTSIAIYPCGKLSLQFVNFMITFTETHRSTWR